MDAYVQDSHTFCACTELLVQHGIDASQTSHNTLVLHNTRDLTVALLSLSSSPLYDAKIAFK